MAASLDAELDALFGPDEDELDADHAAGVTRADLDAVRMTVESLQSLLVEQTSALRLMHSTLAELMAVVGADRVRVAVRDEHNRIVEVREVVVR